MYKEIVQEFPEGINGEEAQKHINIFVTKNPRNIGHIYLEGIHNAITIKRPGLDTIRNDKGKQIPILSPFRGRAVYSGSNMSKSILIDHNPYLGCGYGGYVESRYNHGRNYYMTKEEIIKLEREHEPRNFLWVGQRHALDIHKIIFMVKVDVKSNREGAGLLTSWEG